MDLFESIHCSCLMERKGMWCVFDEREELLGGAFGKSGWKWAILQFFSVKWLLGALCGVEPRQETLVDACVG